MFEQSDTILYGTEGICVIEEITRRTFGGKTQEYYVLRPLYGGQSTIYVPTANEKLRGRMRRLLSAEEVRRIIHAMPEEEPLWIENEPERKQAYARILHDGDRQAMIRIIKALHLRQIQLKAAGRKVHACDERFLRDAEKILYMEFAHVLHMEPGQIPAFIRSQIEQQEQAAGA